MMSKVVKIVAVPVVLGFASLRVYNLSEERPEVLLSPQQLSIYSSQPQESLHYSPEQPGVLQTGFGKVRGGVQSSVQRIQSAYVSVKVTGKNLYHAGEDVYHFLKDPPSGFVPRVSVIAVSGLAGLILSRKGSYLKRLCLPLGMACAGFAVCYPAQTITVFRVSGKKLYAASQWTSSTVKLLWKQDTLPARPASSESAPFAETDADYQAGPISESAQAIEREEPFDEASPQPDHHVQESVSVPQSVSSADEDFLVVAAEGRPSPASPQFVHNQPETLPSQSSGDLQTPAVPEKKGGARNFMDFGQSSPEDADLYSTRS